MFKELSPEEQKEYTDFIKESVANGNYFKDAFDWYIFRYVNPICERTILFFTALTCGFITYALYTIIVQALPIVEQKAVIIEAKDNGLYFPVIKPLKDKTKDEDIRTINEALAKYIIIQYVKEREEYNFEDADIEKLNNKINHVRNNSSIQEYRNFQSKMAQTNPESPILNFGKNISRSITINSFRFKRDQIDNFIDKARDFVSIETPNLAEVRFTATFNRNNEKTISENFLAVISFKFLGIDYAKSSKNLGFLVNDYKIYRVK